MDQRKLLGTAGEDAAAAFLTRRGVHILMRNYRCRGGEIDIIARENGTYLVIEVKSRAGQMGGFPSEAVDYRKQIKICRTFDYFRMKYQLPEDLSVRFDVIEVDQELNCRWIRNAFEYHMVQG